MHENATKIDIIIPTYNGAKHLPGLLTSIKHQTYTHYTCCVIDDHSHDNTVAIVKEQFSWVQVIEQAQNYGPAHNRNVAIQAGHSPYIVIFDDDVFLEDSEWLAKAVHIMEERPNTGQLASMIVSGFDTELLLDCGVDRQGGTFGGRYHYCRKQETEGQHEISRPVLGACSAGTIVRRDVFELVGGFDPKYFYPAEDIDLSLRIHLAGYDVLYEPSLVTYHFESQAMGRAFERKMYLYRRNCLLALVENYPAGAIVKGFLFVVARWVLFPILAFLVRGAVQRKFHTVFLQETRDYIKSFVFLLGNSFNIMKKRGTFDRVRTRVRTYLLDVEEASEKFMKNNPHQPKPNNLEIEEMKKKISQASWYHSYELLPGLVTPGQCQFNARSVLDQLGIPRDLSGKRALDIGTWDGPAAFELEARGATVTAFDIQDPDRTGFNTAKEILQSNVEYVQASVYNLSQVLRGKFDIICFFGVFYHLKYPIMAFEEIEKMLADDGIMLFEGECLINYAETIEGTPASKKVLKALSVVNSELPLTLFYSGKYKNEPSNWFIPNLVCFRSWLDAASLEITSYWMTKDFKQKPYPTQRISGIAKKTNRPIAQEHGFM